jgi:glutamate carboxypeptidase
MTKEIGSVDKRTNEEILSYLRHHQEDMVALLTRLIELESPTNNKQAVDRLGTFLVGQLRDLCATVEILSQPKVGDHVRGHWGGAERGALLLCHMDTVWNVGTVAERPVRVEDGRLFGPGAEDMKGGIVVALWAMRALRQLDLHVGQPITLLLTSDEETGSATSRPIIESEARRSRVVYVLEPAVPPLGSLKTWRKGTGEYRVEVVGRAAHAGADHETGINALEELAHQILDIQRFTDYSTGTTFNVGVAAGGTRPNVVPAQAWARVDVRVMDLEQAAQVEALMQGLREHHPGTRVVVTGGFDRPPMERTPATAALFTKAQSVAADMGIVLTEGGTGGGSDGNLTSALGVPTLDGMGAVGDGGHSVDEYVVISALPERAAILAGMLCSVASH